MMVYKNGFVEHYLLRILCPCTTTKITALTSNMAYNRDWDRGKDYLNSANYDNYDDNSWNNGGGRENVRPRDEDYYSEGKRRKYNNGVCQFHIDACLNLNLLQSYDASQQYDETSYDAGYGQGDHSQDYPNDDRSQQRGFNKKRLVPSESSPHVIFLGLDPDFTEADVCRLPSIPLVNVPITEYGLRPASSISVQ
jgi:RNA-binding protein 5/10